MKSRVTLCVEQLESRDTPTPLVGGAFLPPGIAHAVQDPHVPPPVQVTRGDSVSFMPPGLLRGGGDPHLPASVNVSEAGAVVFLPPGVINGFDPQPDPPSAV
jgi:hypothetical protein